MVMEQEMHWYMRQESQSFSIFCSGDRRPESDRKFRYLGRMSRDVAYRKAYDTWTDTAPPLTSRRIRELERTVAGTD